jgi:hypothetical protein
MLEDPLTMLLMCIWGTLVAWAAIVGLINAFFRSGLDRDKPGVYHLAFYFPWVTWIKADPK